MDTPNIDTDLIRKASERYDSARARMAELEPAANAALDAFNAAVDEHDAAEAELRAAIGSILPAAPRKPAAPPAPSAAPTGEFFAETRFQRWNGTLKGDVLRILSASGKPVGRDEILQGVLAKRTTTKEAVAQALKLLYTDDKVIKRPRRGHYAIAKV